MAVAALEGDLDGLHGPGALHAAEAEAVGHHVQYFDFFGGRGLGFLAFGGFFCGGGTFDFPLGLHLGEAAGRQPLRHFFRRGVSGQLDREGQRNARVARSFATLLQGGQNRFVGVVLHRQRGLTVEQMGGARKQQFEVVVQLRHRAHGGAGVAHRVGLVDGNGWRHAFDAVYGRLVHAVQELACIGTECFHVAALAFGKQGVEHQAGLARAAGAGDDGQFARVDVEVHVLQVVLAGATDANLALGHGVRRRSKNKAANHSRQAAVAKRLAWRMRMQFLLVKQKGLAVAGKPLRQSCTAAVQIICAWFPAPGSVPVPARCI